MNSISFWLVIFFIAAYLVITDQKFSIQFYIFFKYLGVEITTHQDGTYELKQPYLTKRIIQELKLSSVETQKCSTPVACPLLHKYLAGSERVKLWNYRSIAGMMTYIQGI